jgi:signal transduction histidine kinase
MISSTARSGAGLGLYGVREIVVRAGGVVHATSAPGFGTTITVLIPTSGVSNEAS